MARSAAILIDSGNVALIERERAGKLYYLFPGGTVEEGESLEEACVREIWEELGLHVKVGQQIAEVIFNENHQTFYLCEIDGGVFGTGDGEEYQPDLPAERGTYKPMWMPIDQLLEQPVAPKCVCELIVGLANGKLVVPGRFRDYGNGVCERIEE